MSADQIDRLVERLERIEATLTQLVEQRAAKEWYTTAEVGEHVGKSEYTVREWCRKKQVDAERKPNGRGWLISHAELNRIRNGDRPLPEQGFHRRLQRSRAEV